MGLTDNAITFLVAAIVIGVVAIPVVQDSLVTDTETVTEDTFTSSGTLPETFTLSNVEDGVVEDSETVTFVDTTGDGTETQLEDSDYTLDYDTGELTIESVTDATPEDGDEYTVDYEYKPTGYIDIAASRIMVNHITTFLALGLFMYVFMMIRR